MLNLFLQSLGPGYATPPPVEPDTGYVLQSVLADHSYSWWCKPIAIYDPQTGAAYFTTIEKGAVSGRGPHMLHRWYNGQLTSVYLHTGTAIDEHNTPALLILDDHILVTYTGHNIDFLWVRRVAKDLSTMSAEENINANGFQRNSYTQLYRAPSGRVLVFTRKNEHRWAMAWSDDQGVSWSAAKEVIAKSQATIPDKLYMTGQMDTQGVIPFAINHHPTGALSKNEITLLELDTITGNVTSGGVSRGNLYNAEWVPVSVHTLTPVFKPEAGQSVRLLDVTTDSEHTYIAIADFLNSEEAAHYVSGNYRHLKINRQTLEVEQDIVIASHGTDTYSSYFGGVYYVQSERGEWNGQITVAREQGGTWAVDVRKWNGGAFEVEQVLDTLETGPNGLSLTRPQPFVNGHLPGAPLCLYQKGDYDETYTSWANEIKLVSRKVAT